MKKEVKLTSGKIKVSVKLEPWKAGRSKIRVYTQDAREMAEEAYPKEKILGVEKHLTLANYEKDKLEGEWLFKLQKKVKKKSSSKKEEAKVEEANKTQITKGQEEV